jgi:hypothetical protein
VRIVKAHLNAVLYRLRCLRLDACGAFVPERDESGVEADVPEAHGVRGSEVAPAKTGAKPLGIHHAITLLVARSAGNRVVHAEAFVIKQYPPERRAPVSDLVIGRCVVLV